MNGTILLIVKARFTGTVCLHCFIQNFVHVYTSLFHGGEERPLPSPTQGTSSLTSTASTDNSLADMYLSPQRSLPYNADTRYFCLPLERLIFRREKGSSHANKETELLRPNELHEESESVSAKGEWSDFTYNEGSEEYNLRSPVKLSTAEPTMEFAHIYYTSENEDVCPTCLEEYTTENPKIITKCSHHFHLGCIYEWMERSDNCPVFGKVMAFDETA
ncbi:E3 ubiquitin-protein ligase at3g02290 [Phtheirospermum japonicum]|uniref:RING-type E3 ubiquitin transferase n=1 Tax=Phtheirospermum japonicum TaxID=374723 RepID=A0A830D081_9LAMI|nr:E3 ubiquitin-protein ligase at3g02290 [Phtheirospermum japonicum]